MGWDGTGPLLPSSLKRRKFPIAQFKEYQKGYKQLYLQGSPWLWEQNCQETENFIATVCNTVMNAK